MKRLPPHTYGDWLTTSFDWKHWGTITTPYNMSAKSARRCMDGFWKRQKKVYGSLFWSVERHKHHGCHVHYLIGWNKQQVGLQAERFEALEPAIWKSLIRDSRAVTGAESRVHCTRVKSSVDTAQQYVAKYCTKEGGVVDWDLYI